MFIAIFFSFGARYQTLAGSQMLSRFLSMSSSCFIKSNVLCMIYNFYVWVHIYLQLSAYSAMLIYIYSIIYKCTGKIWKDRRLTVTGKVLKNQNSQNKYRERILSCLVFETVSLYSQGYLWTYVAKDGVKPTIFLRQSLLSCLSW